MSKNASKINYEAVIWEWPSIEHYKPLENKQQELQDDSLAPATRRPKKVFTEGKSWHVEEKMDGSQLSFRLHQDSNEIIFRTRNGFIFEKDPFGNKQLAAAVLSISSLKHLLNPHFIYRGEAIVKPRHNRIKYQRCPKFYFVLFDIENCESKCFLHYDEKVAEAQRVSLETAPLLFKATKGIEEEFMVWQILKDLDEGKIHSLLGDNVKPEGIVVKNYNYTKEAKGIPGLLKLVRAEFQEAVHSKLDEAEKKEEITKVIGSQYAVEARYYKAVQRLRDRNELVYNLKSDVPKLVKELDADLLKECKDEIVNALLAKFFPQIAISAREEFNNWYKQRMDEFKREQEELEKVGEKQKKNN